MAFKVTVPGSTSNLGSGFDTFGLALRIYLQVTVEETDGELVIETYGAGAEDLPADRNNLVFRAMERLCDQAGAAVPAVELSMRNDIPLSRGLGSSGAAIIAGLVCGRELAASRISDEELLKLATELEGHAENVAASLFGGLTVNCVTEQQVISHKVAADEALQVVLMIPRIAISTNAARKVLPANIPHSNAVFNIQRSALLAHAFLTRDYDALRTAMQDKIHQPYRQSLIPGYEQFEQTAYDYGALGFCISGSGSTMLCFSQKNTAPLTRALRHKALEQNLDMAVRVTQVENRGAEVTACVQ